MDQQLLNFIYELRVKALDKKRTMYIEKKYTYPKQLIFEQYNVIYEHVLNKNNLITLYNYLMQSSYITFLTNIDIASLLPKNLKIRRKLNHLFINNTLVIFNICFDRKYLDLACNTLFNKYDFIKSEEQLKELKENLNEIFTKPKLPSAIFLSIKGLSDIAFMFLNGAETTEDDFRHEFIHYYQWCTQDDILDLNEIIEIPKNIQLITNQPISKFNLQFIFNKYEVIPYINELIDQLNDFEMTRKLFHEYFKDNKYFVWHTETDTDYVERISKTEFFNYLKIQNKNLLPILVFILMEIFEPEFEHELKVTIFSQLK